MASRRATADRLELALSTGLHLIRLEAPGFEQHEESVEIEAGRVTKVTIALKQLVGREARRRPSRAHTREAFSRSI